MSILHAARGSNLHLHDFRLLQELGRSATGAVFKAQLKRSGQILVLKEKWSSELGRFQDVKHECALLEHLDHPNIISYMGHFFDGPARTLYSVLEFASGGDLQQEIRRRRSENEPFSTQQVMHIFLQVLAGLQHLHEQRIIHRDLKCANLLLLDTAELTVKIGDLGVGRMLADEQDMARTFYGSPHYLSPELCERRAYDRTSDLWSLGVVLYELCALQSPFQGRNPLEIMQAIVNARFETIPDRYPAFFQSTIESLLRREPTQRASARQCAVQWRREEARLLQQRKETVTLMQQQPHLAAEQEAAPTPSTSDIGSAASDTNRNQQRLKVQRRRLRAKLKYQARTDADSFPGNKQAHNEQNQEARAPPPPPPPPASLGTARQCWTRRRQLPRQSHAVQLASDPGTFLHPQYEPDHTSKAAEFSTSPYRRQPRFDLISGTWI